MLLIFSKFFDWLGRLLGYKDMDDWYKISHTKMFGFYQKALYGWSKGF